MKHEPRSVLEGLRPGQVDALRRHAELLSERGVALGVVSEADRERVWERHTLDSLRGARCVPPDLSIGDIGSGGGLPGVPIAIARPDLQVHLVEPRRRRVAFLELVVEALGLRNVAVIAARAQETSLSLDGCVARALAPAAQSWNLCEPLLRSDGFLLYWAGRSWGATDTSGLMEAGLGVEVCDPASEVWQGSVLKMARTVLSEPATP